MSSPAPISHLLRRCLALFSLAVIAFGLSAPETALGQAPGSAPSPSPKKVLILGNSITRHGPKADIGWMGNWGMAASAEEKDFVHVIMSGLTRPDAKPEFMVKNIADFERGYAGYDVAEKLKDCLDFKADLAILAIGENVPGLATEEAKAQFKASALKLVKALKGDGSARVVVRSSFWANAAKDQALKEAAAEGGATFVDISALSKDESNYARSERPFKHEGVAKHPGDKGMQAIAEAILGAVKKG